MYTLIFNVVWPAKLFNFWDIAESAAGQGIVLLDKVRQTQALQWRVFVSLVDDNGCIVASVDKR
jgi:hypothetical protein